MKATGIVRRIDDLGRVVIPKEIRRTMRIREGDPLEIYTDREGEVIFKKYSPIGELNNFAAEYAETLYKTAEMPVAVCDRDSVIACAGVPKKEFLDKSVSGKADEVMSGRTMVKCNEEQRFDLTGDPGQTYKVSTIMPILSQGDVIGAVASLKSEEKPSRLSPEAEQKLVQTAAGFLGRQIELS